MDTAGETFRSKVYQACLQVLEDRIAQAELALENAREAVREDTKSSAGDKYETTRERLQQDIRGHQTQLAESQKMRFHLEQLKKSTPGKTIQAGTLVKTNLNEIFLAVSIGWIEVNDKRLIVLSPESPIGRLLLGKSVGDRFTLNGVQQTILDLGELNDPSI